MLWTIFVILFALWLVGLIGGVAFGGFLHLFLVLAVITLVAQLVAGRRTI
jgi:Family of unknown function (DUF5670)